MWLCRVARVRFDEQTIPHVIHRNPVPSLGARADTRTHTHPQRYMRAVRMYEPQARHRVLPSTPRVLTLLIVGGPCAYYGQVRHFGADAVRGAAGGLAV